MRKFIGGASILLALAFAGPAHAWDDPPKPPAPAPAAAANAAAAASASAKANAAASASSYNVNQNKNLQFQGQFQKQTATGGAGGNVTNNITTGTGGGAAPAAAAPGNTTVNNNGGAQPSATYANVHTSSDGVNPWTNPVASAVAPSVYAASICQSAISGAAQTPLFGISFGSVQGLDVCIKMMLAEQAKTDGRPDVANYFRCQTKEFRDAYKATGTPCAQDQPKQVASAIPTPASQGISVGSVAGVPPGCRLNQPGNYLTC